MANEIFNSQYSSAQIEAAIANSAPMVGANGNWWLWDIVTMAWVDTFVKAKAEATGSYTGTYNSLEELEQVTANISDYAFVESTDSDGNAQKKQYSYTESGWVYQYTLNNNSFTSEQWEAINSGITSESITEIQQSIESKSEKVNLYTDEAFIYSDPDWSTDPLTFEYVMGLINDPSKIVIMNYSDNILYPTLNFNNGIEFTNIYRYNGIAVGQRVMMYPDSTAAYDEKVLAYKEYVDSEVNQLKEDIDEVDSRLSESITEIDNKTDAFADFYQTSENMFDKSTAEVGKMIQSNGVIVTNSNSSLSDYIPVRKGWTIYGYIAPVTITALGSWFDSNKVHGGKIEDLTGYELTNRSKRYFTLKVNFDGYIRMNVYINAPYQNVMVKLNTTIDTSLSEPLCQNTVPYEEPYWKVGVVKASTKWDASFIERNNIFDRAKSVSGYLNPDGTGVWSNANYKTSDYILIDASTKYVIQGITTRFCLYDASKTPIASTYDNTDVANREFTNDAYSFVRFTYYVTEEERMYVRKESEGFFDTFMKHSYIHRENPLLGKKLLALGDSIMEGNGNGNFGIGDIIASRNSMYLKDVSKGGATVGYMASRAGQQTLIQHQKDMAIASTFEPDYIIIDGQTNDIDKASSTPQTDKITLGEVTGAYDSEFVNTSFAGGLEIIFRDLKAKYPTAKIVYVRVHHIGSRGLNSQNTYGNVAKSVCEKWGVPIADIYNNGTMNTFLDEYVQYTSNGDKTHPNRLGYDNFYVNIIEKAMVGV